MDRDIKNTLICLFSGFGAFCFVTGMIFFAVSKTDASKTAMGGFEMPSAISYSTDEFIDSIVDMAEEQEQGSIAISYISYRIRRGDMISRIAEKFDVTQDTLISVNNIKSTRSIQPGEYIKIPSVPGILYTVKKDGETIASLAEKFAIDSDLCASTNDLEADRELKAGQNMFLPGAKLDAATIAEINGDLFRKPIRRSYYLSSYFGWRANPFTGARSYHSGIDMACPQGTQIYAALAGTVTETGYNNIYGNYVVITHHSGYKTLYGHMSAILAVRGQAVNTNTCIGKVGSTGMSTGPHLHFTVFKNGSRVNPLNYLP